MHAMPGPLNAYSILQPLKTAHPPPPPAHILHHNSLNCYATALKLRRNARQRQCLSCMCNHLGGTPGGRRYATRYTQTRNTHFTRLQRSTRAHAQQGGQARSMNFCVDGVCASAGSCCWPILPENVKTPFTERVLPTP